MLLSPRLSDEFTLTVDVFFARFGIKVSVRHGAMSIDAGPLPDWSSRSPEALQNPATWSLRFMGVFGGTSGTCGCGAKQELPSVEHLMGLLALEANAKFASDVVGPFGLRRVADTERFAAR